MCVYLRAKFEVSSTIITSFRQGVPQNGPPKSPPRLVIYDKESFLYSTPPVAASDNQAEDFLYLS